MKHLNEHILESILDIDSNLERDDIKTLIENWLKKYNINNYTINDDYTIDVKGSVNIIAFTGSSLPNYINFNNVDEFSCSHCSNLKTLRGCPKNVSDYFACGYCKSLTTLEGGPRDVGGNFLCNFCKNLESLKGCPEKIGTALIKSKMKVLGVLDCTQCTKLRNIHDADKYDYVVRT